MHKDLATFPPTPLTDFRLNIARSNAAHSRRSILDAQRLALLVRREAPGAHVELQQVILLQPSLPNPLLEFLRVVKRD